MQYHICCDCTQKERRPPAATSEASTNQRAEALHHPDYISGGPTRQMGGGVSGHQTSDALNGLDIRQRKFIERVRSAQPGNYSLRFTEVMLIASLHNNNAVDASSDYFRAGFIKGMVAADAAKKGGAS